AASAEMAVSTEPSPRPAAASKKPQKTARSHQRRREPTGTDTVWWREVRAEDAARGYGERDYGRGGYAREGAFGLSYGQRDYGRGGDGRGGGFGVFPSGAPGGLSLFFAVGICAPWDAPKRRPS